MPPYIVKSSSISESKNEAGGINILKFKESRTTVSLTVGASALWRQIGSGREFNELVDFYLKSVRGRNYDRVFARALTYISEFHKAELIEVLNSRPTTPSRKTTARAKPLVVYLRPVGSVSWPSLKQIFPAIENFWLRCAKRGGFDLKVIEGSIGGAQRNLPLILSADLIVVPGIDRNTSGVLSFVRSTMKHQCPFVLYSLGSANFQMRNFRAIEKHLGTKDCFVVACEQESKSIRLIYRNASILEISYPLPPIPRGSKKQGAPKSPNVIYLGRLSEQKNLHTLLWALSLIRQRQPGLPLDVHIYGTLDPKALPDLGPKYPRYRRYLRSLAAQLGLEENVTWHSPLDFQSLKNMLSRSWSVFVSPSLYLHEDFGAAAFQVLSCGLPAVLSAWGGHHKLKKMFPRQVSLVKAYSSQYGPFISASELANNISSALQNFAPEDPSRVRAVIQKEFQECEKKIQKIIFAARTSREDQPLRLTNLGKKLIKPSSTAIESYSSFSDSRLRPFLRSYGAKSRLTKRLESKIIELAPWVKRSGSFVHVNDPGRGRTTQRFHLRWLFDNGLGV